MSIGIDFVLRASSQAFTAGLAKANKAVKDLKHELHSFGAPRGLSHLFGLVGVLEGFKVAIEGARKTREELEKLGKPVDEATESVAKYGDALEELGKKGSELLTKSLSYFTLAGEGWGMLINRLRGVSAEQEKINEETEKAAKLQEKARDKLYEEKTARSKTIDKELSESENAASLSSLGAEEKRNRLLEERTKLLDEIEKMPVYEEGDQMGKTYNVARKEKEIRANKLTAEIGSLGKEVQSEHERKSSEQLRKGEEEYKKAAESDQKYHEQQKKLIETLAPTVENLAGKNVGGFFDANSPVLRARQALDAEKHAREAFNRGDYRGGLTLANKAKGLRDSLEMQTSETGALTPKTAETAVEKGVSEALKDTNVKLDDLTKAVQGIIKAQK